MTSIIFVDEKTSESYNSEQYGLVRYFNGTLQGKPVIFKQQQRECKVLPEHANLHHFLHTEAVKNEYIYASKKQNVWNRELHGEYVNRCVLELARALTYLHEHHFVLPNLTMSHVLVRWICLH